VREWFAAIAPLRGDSRSAHDVVNDLIRSSGCAQNPRASTRICLESLAGSWAWRSSRIARLYLSVAWTPPTFWPVPLRTSWSYQTPSVGSAWPTTATLHFTSPLASSTARSSTFCAPRSCSPGTSTMTYARSSVDSIQPPTFRLTPFAKISLVEVSERGGFAAIANSH
jgi:hypothetical protein